MKKTQTETVEYLECDGCNYVIGIDKKCAVLSMPFKGEVLQFHFHCEPSQNDCFRYWAHNPSIMERSLRDRWADDFGAKEIDERVDLFMATHLYRKDAFGAGVAREPLAAQRR